MELVGYLLIIAVAVIGFYYARNNQNQNLNKPPDDSLQAIRNRILDIEILLGYQKRPALREQDQTTAAYYRETNSGIASKLKSIESRLIEIENKLGIKSVKSKTTKPQEIYTMSQLQEAERIIEAQNPENAAVTVIAPLISQNPLVQLEIIQAQKEQIPVYPGEIKQEEIKPEEQTAALSPAEAVVEQFLTKEAPAYSIISENDEPYGEIKTESEIYSVTSETITGPAAKKDVYSEKAGKFEMDLAGNWLNVLGILLLGAGVILFLRQAFNTMTSGMPQTMMGTLIGVVLLWLGDKMHRNGMKKLGESLLSGGFCILLFVISASFFYFHIIKNPAVLAVLLFGIVAVSGVSIFRYDSRIIANVVLLIAFMAPFLMKFQLEDLKILYFYLIAINLAVTFVAYYKKWDYYITVSFLMTYLHYFLNYSLIRTHTGMTLIFLTVFYLTFLVSNNIIHLKQKTPNGYNQFISYFNPLLFGCLSYYIFINDPRWLQPNNPNWQALLLYSFLGYIHLYLTKQSSKLEQFDPQFTGITKNNLVIGLMFITTAISFVTYFTDTDKLFWVVTVLWFMQAFTLLLYSFRSDFYSRIFRRFSYLTLVIIWAQLISVLSWMPVSESGEKLFKYSIYFAAIALFFVYHLVMRKHKEKLENEDLWFLALTLLSCFAVVIYLTYIMLHLYMLMLMLSIVAMLIIAYSFRAGVKPELFRSISYFIIAGVSLTLVAYELERFTNLSVKPFYTMILPAIAAVFILTLCILYRKRAEIPGGEEYFWYLIALMPPALIFAAFFRYFNYAGNLAFIAFLANTILLMAFLFREKLKGLRVVAFIVMCIITLASLFVSHEDPIQFKYGSLFLTAFFFFNAWWFIRKYENDMADDNGQYQVALFSLIFIVLMKLVVMKAPGMTATLAWATLGFIAVYLSLHRFADFRFRKLADLIFFVSTAKAIVYDSSSLNMAASYTKLKSGLQEATTIDSISSFSFGPIAGDVVMILLITAIYYLSSRTMNAEPRTRDFFQTYGLLSFSFLTSGLLFSVFGLLDNFQIILTIFWCSSSILFIILGITIGRKIFRQFGLILLIASAAKIGLVDLWVLGFYNMVYPLLITGTVLIAVSFLYQKNKEKLEERNAGIAVENTASI
ncbi:MAG: DUF2339 domain-containing protein [Firmicutes bacterium]|nr:DUF2339 domain-containing protein [Bacillota bacterium]